MTNEDLVIRIKKHIDVADNMLQLWQQNTGMITQMANKYRFMAEKEDLQQPRLYSFVRCNSSLYTGARRSFLYGAIPIFAGAHDALLSKQWNCTDSNPCSGKCQRVSKNSGGSAAAGREKSDGFRDLSLYGD